MTDRKTTRIQLELPEKAMNRLVELKNKTEATSYAEVIKNALRLYESLILKHEEGTQLILKSREGTLTEYEVFLH